MSSKIIGLKDCQRSWGVWSLVTEIFLFLPLAPCSVARPHATPLGIRPACLKTAYSERAVHAYDTFATPTDVLISTVSGSHGRLQSENIK